MKLPAIFIVGLGILLSRGIDGNHFLGGTITWKPLNQSATGSPVAIVITQTYVFNYTAMQCSNAMIMNNSFVPNYFGMLAFEKLECVINCGSGAVGYTNISVIPRCTDYSVPGVSIVGQRSDTVYLQSGVDFTAAFMSGYWRSLATVTSGNWSIATRINVDPRPDNGLYNNAPVATMMSPINLPFNKTVAIHIPVADADGDTMRCRWANRSNGVDECSSVCPPASLPPNTILFPNCTIIITGKNISDAYAVAVVVEDFINSTSREPLSSVPVQFLVEVVSAPTCTIPPDVVGIPPEGACIPVIVGQTYHSELIAINHCGSSVAITDIATLSFAGVIQSNITKQNTTTFHKIFTWTPTAAQLGYQVMCAMAFDSQDVQSSQYCFNFYVSANTTTDCPGKITLTTYISTTSSTTSSTTTSTTSSTSSSSTTSTSSTTTTTETTSFISTSTSSTSTSTTITTDTTYTSSSSSSTSTSSTSTGSTSTTLTSSTSTTATTVITTASSSKQQPFNWPLFGIILGLILLAALALCCCYCWCYLWPLVAVSSEYRKGNKPMLYHIEPCFDPECRGWDRLSRSDIPLGHYRNLARISSETLTNRVLNSSVNPSEMNRSIFLRDYPSFLSFSASSHAPLVHVSVSRVSLIERDAIIGNTRIQPPPGQIIDKENDRPRRRKENNSVLVSRIRSFHKQKISPDIVRDRVKVTHVHSMSANTPSQSILTYPSESTFLDHEPSQAISISSVDCRNSSHFNDRLLSSNEMNQIKTSISARISAKNPVRVHRISRRDSNASSVINPTKQKRKIIRVKRISRTKTA